MQRWRKLLLPISWIYGAIIFIRNYLFDIQFFKSVSYDFPVICIGNVSVGGTGKTPITEYLAILLCEKYKIAILSRGYKRASKGFVLANENISVEKIGDEPFQYFKKLKGVAVAVDEDRRHGISKLKEVLNLDAILLDDAFQHRKVKAGLNILLTMYNDLYTSDFLLPAGNLRDLKLQAKRADVIVLTKCPLDFSSENQQKIIQQLKVQPHQKVFFAGINYKNEVFSNTGSLLVETLKEKEITVVTGIARPEPFLKHLLEKGLNFKHYKYPDHHNFSASEIEYLKEKEFVLTTEKDFVRLEKQLNNIYYMSIETTFLNNQEVFDTFVLDFVAKNS